MSIQSTYRHTIVVKRLVDAEPAVETGYNQPTQVAATVATIPGLIQPRSAREVALSTEAGVVIGQHVGYIDPLANLLTGDWLEVGGVRYDILAIADAGGQGHHFELSLKQVS